MAIKRRRRGKPTIDLAGPQGNAWFLLGTAEKLKRQMGASQYDIDALLEDMQSKDFKHLISVFDKHFGSIVDLIRPPRDDNDSD